MYRSCHLVGVIWPDGHRYEFFYACMRVWADGNSERILTSERVKLLWLDHSKPDTSICFEQSGELRFKDIVFSSKKVVKM